MLFLVRHGATDQPQLRAPGDLTPATRDEWLLDHGLSERGEREAKWLEPRLTALGLPDRVLSSPRRRTIETAQHALPAVAPELDERLHEWHADEPMDVLAERAGWLIELGNEGTICAFTHGGFVRAVMARVLVGDELSRFPDAFHDLRRKVHVWNGSVTLVGHGPTGLELLAVNLCPAIDELAGRR